MAERLRILILEDKPENIAAAMHQLGKDHDLTITSSYDEAEDRIQCDYEKVRAEIGAEYGKYGSTNERQEARRKYKLEKAPFDVVLTDLILPASANQIGPAGKSKLHELSPVGTFIVLLALKHGVKRVGLLTLASHHSEAASACVDGFRQANWRDPMFRLGDAKVLLDNNFSTTITPDQLSDEIKAACKLPETKYGYYYVKDWKEMLDRLLSEEEPILEEDDE